MSTSEARILANRANALKSTGPRSEAGKLQSRRNSLQHGLAGAGMVLLPADEAKLLERRSSWSEVLKPVDEVEVFLVERAVLHSVKLDRLSTVESALACESVERADREYEANSLANIERVEAQVRDWERVEGELQLRGTLIREALDVLYRLLGIEGPEDPRRSDILALVRAASNQSGGVDESAREQARATLADLIGARLDERRRALARLFDDLQDPRGRALARASASLDVGPIGQLAHRYAKAEELGLTRLLDQLERRRRARSEEDAFDSQALATQNPNPTDQTSQTAQSLEIHASVEDLDHLGNLPNEPNDHRTDGSGDLGKLPNEPNDGVIEADRDGSGDLGKLPNEPNAVPIADRAVEFGGLEVDPVANFVPVPAA